MDIESYTKEKILADVAKLQYLYKMKEVTRYNQDRSIEDSTESVAEHVYGMLILANYFLPLEDPDNKINRAVLYEMILYHDIDEIETGDTLGYRKTEADRANELEAMKRTLKNAPELMQQKMASRVEEYEAKETPEAKFAKAIDKIEPLVQIFNEKWKRVLKENKTTPDESLRIKTPYIQDFLYIKKFNDAIHQELLSGDYYWTEEK